MFYTDVWYAKGVNGVHLSKRVYDNSSFPQCSTEGTRKMKRLNCLKEVPISAHIVDAVWHYQDGSGVSLFKMKEPCQAVKLR